MSNKDYKITEDGMKNFDILISCPKCHGNGTFKVPLLTDDGWECEYEERRCEICHGKGKLTVEDYEWLQEQCRRKQ